MWNNRVDARMVKDVSHQRQTFLISQLLNTSFSNKCQANCGIQGAARVIVEPFAQLPKGSFHGEGIDSYCSDGSYNENILMQKH